MKQMTPDIEYINREGINKTAINEPPPFFEALNSPEARLFLTAEDMKLIKEYVRTAKKLPKTLPDIHEQLGKLETAEFSALELLTIHESIHRHALLWPDIETGLFTSGERLKVFSHNLTTFITRLSDTISQMPIVEKIEKFESTSIEHLPPITFDPVDEKIHKTLGSTFDDLKISIAKASSETDNLHKEITSFNNKLEQHLIPLVARSINTLSKVSHAEHADRLMLRLNDVRETHKQKNNEKTKLLAFDVSKIGLSAGNPISLFINFFNGPASLSPELIDVIHHVGKLNREITQLESEILATEGIPKLVTNHSLSLRTLQTVMGSAAEATEKLKTVWATIIAHIETSATDFKLIKTGQALISFQANIDRTIAPWKEVNLTVSALLDVLYTANQSNP
ncbi:alpha-xenorhabdolysin family binary toxin subunit A [Pseudomonas helleri]|uniref:alpha-xenorhabdolysin family binary toxin subunit A n=1 Tax=Pseudomonas helleri TaxID=1608996 RepID=UPI00242BC2AD|nr:alpha-xenorhabdolysin family binary toxin subunit A [Pseudomonas helleri]